MKLYNNIIISKICVQGILILLLFSINSCISQFVPVIEEEKELLVVQGLITDQMGNDTVKLSKSLPLGVKSAARPVSGCIVFITNDSGDEVYLQQQEPGTYVVPSYYQAETGRSYTLHIRANSEFSNFSYESIPMILKPVPPIDNLYYEKKVIEKPDGFYKGVDECQIYLDTHDTLNNCRLYRWDYSETWMLRLLFDVPNHICWLSNKSNQVFIETTKAFSEDRIKRHPVTYISSVTDRLKTKYSILVNQYSLNEDEYIYWQKIQNIADNVGGLYDLIPASVPGNMRCIERPQEKVLGYFSVSSIVSRRLFIKDNFNGIIDLYGKCITDTVIGEQNIPDLGVSVWTLFDHVAIPWSAPRMRVLTDNKGCADCSLRGSTIRPSFWIDDK
jgi:hypothetical protein